MNNYNEVYTLLKIKIKQYDNKLDELEKQNQKFLGTKLNPTYKKYLEKKNILFGLRSKLGYSGLLNKKYSKKRLKKFLSIIAKEQAQLLYKIEKGLQFTSSNYKLNVPLQRERISEILNFQIELKQERLSV